MTKRLHPLFQDVFWMRTVSRSLKIDDQNPVFFVSAGLAMAVPEYLVCAGALVF